MSASHKTHIPLERKNATGQMEVCPFCNERPATLLCDFVIGFEWKGEMGDVTMLCVTADGHHFARKTGEQYRVIARDGEMFTCDRSVCVECATNDGAIHYCGKHCEHDSIDYCPQCRAAPREGLRAISSEEAAIERKQMWKRSQGRLVAVPSVEPEVTKSDSASE